MYGIIALNTSVCSQNMLYMKEAEGRHALRRENHVIAWHRRSDGGLAAALNQLRFLLTDKPRRSCPTNDELIVGVVMPLSGKYFQGPDDPNLGKLLSTT